jgi:large subunit ribosomal protein L10
MAKTKAQKKDITDKLESAFKAAASTVFVHFKGMTIVDESALRKTFREEGVKYLVAKKTLIGRALTALGHAHESVPMDGEIAVAYNTNSTDAVAPARLVHTFAEKLKGKLAIVGGIFEGKLQDAAAMKAIATIPSLDVLRGMFAQVINSPRQRFAVVLSEVAKTKTS